jgi:predicted transcriptional regulator
MIKISATRFAYTTSPLDGEIYQLLLNHGSLSEKELTEKQCTSLSSVRRALDRMLSQQLIFSSTEFRGIQGRPVKVYLINPNSYSAPLSPSKAA